ncbi:MAG: tetratricopeptide repeat protein [Proteobacteria bacterium]|nr:tetratricopeptide repeat protein [Pseudomonadota bacterium]MBU1686817.1 tetratricopeptide repeat protein [Pseudomonadota bacterium]
MREAKEGLEAIKAFLAFQSTYPDDPRASEALWLAALLNKEIASVEQSPNWESVRDFFRDLAITYPDAPQAPAAYLEVIAAHLKMHLYREALGYLNIFLEKYPQSAEFPNGIKEKARVLMKIGKISEARELCLAYLKKDEITFRELEWVMAEIYLEEGQLELTIQTADRLMGYFPDISQERLDAIRIKGLALLDGADSKARAEGRSLLFYFVNVSGSSGDTFEIMAKIAENYLRDGEETAARLLYKKIVESVSTDEYPKILSRFRLVWLVDRSIPDEQWSTYLTTAPSAEDTVYQNFLEGFYTDRAAQDARYGLLKRFEARGDSEQAYDLGQRYLQQGGGLFEAQILVVMEGILARKMQSLLDSQSYSDLYDLYKREYPVIRQAGKGRPLLLTGRALEGLGLLKQAALVYYRALALSLTDEEKSELYFRRAGIYLATGDLVASERLLKFMRRLYADHPRSGEIYALSGRLRERQNRMDDALLFYKFAIEKGGPPASLADALVNRIRLLLAQDRLDESVDLLTQADEKQWLLPESFQEIYAHLGKVAIRLENNEMARWAMESALSEGGDSGEQIQEIHLLLGDVYVKLGLVELGLKQYEMARNGDDSRLSTLARERIMQAGIEKSLVNVSGILEPK